MMNKVTKGWGILSPKKIIGNYKRAIGNKRTRGRNTILGVK